MLRILAVDQSSNISGWALFENHKLVDYGRFIAHGGKAERLHKIKLWFEEMVDVYEPDLIAIEEIIKETGSQFFTTFKTLANVQGLLEMIAFEKKVKLIIVNASSWKKNLGITGKGRVV